MNDEEKQAWFDSLILEGVVEVSGIDAETGEMLYNFSPDIPETHPDIFERMVMQIQQEIYLLWEKGFLHMDIDNENPLVTITEKALDEEAIKTELTRDEQRSLEVIKFYMKS